MKALMSLMILLSGIYGTSFISCEKLGLNVETFQRDVTRIIAARQKTGEMYRQLGINKQSKTEEQKIIKEINGLLERLSVESIKKTITATKERAEIAIKRLKY